MPLIPCPDCDSQCSTNAESCPKCGYRFTKKINLAEGLSALGAFGSSLRDKIKTAPKDYTFPLSIGRDFVLNKDSINYKGKKYDLPNDVSRIYIGNVEYSALFIPAVSIASFNIEMLNGDKVGLAQSGLLAKREFRKKIRLASSYIRRVTHKSRYQRYLTKLTNNKELEIEGITIHSDGHISKGRKKINLVESYEKNYISKGIEYGTPGVTWSGSNPSALFIGGNGTGRFSKKIITEFRYDSDVLNKLILVIAKNPIH